MLVGPGRGDILLVGEAPLDAALGDTHKHARPIDFLLLGGREGRPQLPDDPEDVVLRDEAQRGYQHGTQQVGHVGRQERHGVVGDGEVAAVQIHLGAVVAGAPLAALPAIAHRRNQLVEVGRVVAEEHLHTLAARALLRVGVEALKDLVSPGRELAVLEAAVEIEAADVIVATLHATEHEADAVPALVVEVVSDRLGLVAWPPRLGVRGGRLAVGGAVGDLGPPLTLGFLAPRHPLGNLEQVLNIKRICGIYRRLWTTHHAPH